MLLTDDDDRFAEYAGGVLLQDLQCEHIMLMCKVILHHYISACALT